MTSLLYCPPFFLCYPPLLGCHRPSRPPPLIRLLAIALLNISVVIPFLSSLVVLVAVVDVHLALVDVHDRLLNLRIVVVCDVGILLF